MLPSDDRSLPADFLDLVDLARATLEAEIWVLRQQINVLRRAAPRRQSFGIFDRLIFVGLYRLFPKGCDALAIEFLVCKSAMLFGKINCLPAGNTL